MDARLHPREDLTPAGAVSRLERAPRWRRGLGNALLVLVQFAVIGCAAIRADDPAPLPEGSLTVHAATGEHPLTVELAETPDARARGLRGRDHLPEDRGMLFLFPEDRRGGFWMHGVRIPLDIAFADAEGRILRVLQMEPCDAALALLCPSYRPGVRYRMALELPAGWLASRGVGPGDRIVLGEVRPDPR